MLFATTASDEKGLLAAEILGQQGYNIKVLVSGEQAPAESIALFTPLREVFQGSRGRFLRCSAIRLRDELVPAWARSTHLRVAVIRTQKEVLRARKLRQEVGGLETALTHMARRYQNWLKEGSSLLVPWFTSERDPRLACGTSCRSELEQWLACPEVQKFRSISIIRKVAASDIRTVPVAGWRVNIASAPKVFPAAAAEQALAMLGRWSSCFPREQTWVQNRLGLPSMLVRLDCIVEDGVLQTYEIEERPAGVGISGMVNPEFRSQFQKLAQTWQPFRVEVSPLRKATDDPLWVKDLAWEGIKTDLVLVRAEPEEEQFHCLEADSVSSLKAKGDKSYGLKLGLWRQVSSTQELNWNGCFVLKPLQGSKLKDLEIWDSLHRPGSSPKTRVEEALRKNGSMFCQQLYPPMDSGMQRFPWMIYRIFFGYNCATKQWECLGGNYNARHNLRIHGASDAVFGPAIVQ